MPPAVVSGVLTITLAIAGLLVIRPGITAGRGGKVLAFFGLFILPVFAGLVGFDDHLERSKQTRFCLSCHILEPYGRSLYVDNTSHIPAVHFQNNLVPRDQACYTCHTDYTLYTGGIKAKIRGLRRLYVQYLGTPSRPIRLYEPFNNRECLHCHLGARKFEEETTHDALMNEIKSNQISCMSSGCHELVHDVSRLNQMKFWTPRQ